MVLSGFMLQGLQMRLMTFSGPYLDLRNPD